MPYHDLKSALRALRRRPALTLVAVVVLALGLGVNTAAFSVLDAVLLRSLPAADPERLVYLVSTFVDRGGYFAVRRGDYDLWRGASHSFSNLAAREVRTFALSGHGPVERVSGAAVTPSYFTTLGVAPVLGRAFTEKDVAEGERVVVLSRDFWRRRFGADPAILGRSLASTASPTGSSA
jgi:putative ABC transport system permease protein